MGGRSERIQRLKRDHPVCFFCAERSTETEDHVPSRECFKNREGPEGFVFPACRRCNGLSSQFEQVVAFYLMLGDHDEGGFIQTQFEKLGRGVANNNPEMLPSMNLDARAARRHYRDTGLSLPKGFTFGEAPLAELPADNRLAFDAFARRLTCALFYKEVGHPLPLDFHVGTGWNQFIDPKSRDVEAVAINLFPNLTLTERRNTNIGDQFTYRWGYKEGELFGFVAQFRKSFYFLGSAVSPSVFASKEAKGEIWRTHQSDIPHE